MKFFLALLLSALLSFIGGLYFQWWSIAVACFLVALLIRQTAGKSFAAAFLGLLLLWAGLASWINMKNENILSARIGELLGIGNNAFLLILITGIVGALVAGFAAMSASYLVSSKTDN